MSSKIILFGILIIAITSCSDTDNDDNISMNIQVQYEGNPFVFFNDYTYPDGRTFNLSRLSFYMSEVTLSDGTTTSESGDPLYIDLTNSHATQELADEGLELTFEETGITEVSELQFNIGLDATTNATNPNDYTSSNPLSRSAEYWSSWNSYIFAKIEGNIDLDGDNVKETGFTLHLGSDDALRRLSFSQSQVDNTIDVTIDIEDIFISNGVIFDLEEVNRIHSLNQMEDINWLMDRLSDAIRVE